MTPTFLLTARFALLTMAIALVMSFYRPGIEPPRKLPRPYRSGVVAIEFARDGNDVRAILTDQKGLPDQPFIQKMVNLTYLDFLFIVAYTGFLILFVGQVYSGGSVVAKYAVVGIALGAGLCDVLENSQLLQLFSQVQHSPNAGYDTVLYRLSLFTWCKWLGLAVVPVLLIPYLWRSNWLGRLTAGVSALALPTGIAALVRHQSILIVAFTTLVFLTLLGLMVYSVYTAGFFHSFRQSFLLPVSGFLGKIFGKLWKYFKLLFLNKYLRCGVAILRTLWPLLLVLMVTHLFLNMMDQSQDLLDSLRLNAGYSICMFAALLLYGTTVWYTTRIVLILKDQRTLIDQESVGRRPRGDSSGWTEQTDAFDRIDEDTLELFVQWTPVTLGVIPFVSMLVAFGNVENTPWHQLALIGLILLYVWIAYQVRNYVDDAQYDERTIDRKFFADLLPEHKRAIRIGFVGGIALVILATYWYTNVLLSSLLGPLTVVFMALTLWAMIAGWFTYIDYRYRAPFTLVCLVLMTLFDNNNHQIQTITTDPEIGDYSGSSLNRQPIPEHFNRWLDSLTHYRTNEEYDSTAVTPVYLIATEGGGIRSAYWTASILKQLDRFYPGFFRHVYAISGVSGGSVGAAFYTARHRDKLLHDSLKIDVDKFFEHDHLSPLLTAMLIPDMLQKFLPVGVNVLDRARYMENSWDEKYKDVQQWPTPDSTPAETLNQPFMRLWAGDKGSYRYKVPILFLNATQAETGRKGILTPLAIGKDENFSDVIDIQQMVYRHIPLKTAASMSARFPFVTPPATVRVVNEPSRDAANFVDGGYIDNSGTTTLLSVLSSITSNTACVQKLSGRRRVVFKLILLKNSADTDPCQAVKPLGGLYEVQAPLRAFFESWDNSGGYRRYAVREYLRGFSILTINSPNKQDSPSSSKKAQIAEFSKSRLIDPNMYSFDLDRKTGIIPLGWELSEQAELNIRNQAHLQVSTIKQDSTGLIGGLKKAKQLFNKK